MENFFAQLSGGQINFSDGEVDNLKWFELDNLPDNVFHLSKPVLNALKEYLKTNEPIVD